MVNSEIVLYDSEPTLSDIRLIDFDPEKAFELGVNKTEAYYAVNNLHVPINSFIQALPHGLFSDLKGRALIQRLCLQAEIEDENQIFRIKNIIKLAFKFRFRYSDFKKLAETCGYECAAFFPPYFLLHYFLNKEDYDFAKYRNKLLNNVNIHGYLLLRLIIFSSFDEAFIQLFYDRFISQHKKIAPLNELKNNKEFQIESIRYFFETYFTY